MPYRVSLVLTVEECWLLRGRSVLYSVSLVMYVSLSYRRRKHVDMLGCFRKTNYIGGAFKSYLCQTDNFEI